MGEEHPQVPGELRVGQGRETGRLQPEVAERLIDVGGQLAAVAEEVSEGVAEPRVGARGRPGGPVGAAGPGRAGVAGAVVAFEEVGEAQRGLLCGLRRPEPQRAGDRRPGDLVSAGEPDGVVPAAEDLPLEVAENDELPEGVVGCQPGGDVGVGADEVDDAEQVAVAGSAFDDPGEVGAVLVQVAVLLAPFEDRVGGGPGVGHGRRSGAGCHGFNLSLKATPGGG